LQQSCHSQFVIVRQSFKETGDDSGDEKPVLDFVV
jgi:hypothetical protein